MWNCNHSGVITGTSWAESLLSSFRAYLEPVSPQWQYQEDSRETSSLTLSPSWGLTLCYNVQSNVPWKIMLWSGSQMLVRISCYPLFGFKHLGSSLSPTRCFPLETEAWINVLCLWIKHLCNRFKTFLTVLALKMHSLNFFSAPCCHSSCVWCFLAAFFVSFSDFFCYCFLEIPNKRAEEKPGPLISSLTSPFSVLKPNTFKPDVVYSGLALCWCFDQKWVLSLF